MTATSQGRITRTSPTSTKNSSTRASPTSDILTKGGSPLVVHFGDPNLRRRHTSVVEIPRLDPRNLGTPAPRERNKNGSERAAISRYRKHTDAQTQHQLRAQRQRHESFQEGEVYNSPSPRGYIHTTHSIHREYAHAHHTRPYTHTVYTNTDNTRRGCDRPQRTTHPNGIFR
jgi:hypothetical protein